MNDNKIKQKLGTDRVKELFGEVKPQVIYQDENKRAILTKSLDDVVGAYSIVHFDKFGRRLMPDIHKEVLQGQFIGETFRKYGIPTHREEECIFVYRLPSEFQKIFGNSGKESFCKRVKFRIGHVRVPYASI